MYMSSKTHHTCHATHLNTSHSTHWNTPFYSARRPHPMEFQSLIHLPTVWKRPIIKNREHERSPHPHPHPHLLLHPHVCMWVTHMPCHPHVPCQSMFLLCVVWCDMIWSWYDMMCYIFTKHLVKVVENQIHNDLYKQQLFDRHWLVNDTTNITSHTQTDRKKTHTTNT